MNVWIGEKCRVRVGPKTHSSWPNIYFEIYILSWLRSKWEKSCALCTHTHTVQSTTSHILHYTLYLYDVWARASVCVLYQYNTFSVIQSLILDPLNLYCVCEHWTRAWAWMNVAVIIFRRLFILTKRHVKRKCIHTLCQCKFQKGRKNRAKKIEV